MMRVVLLATIAVMFRCAFGNQHFLLAPQIIREGASETVVLNLHGVQGIVDVVAYVDLVEKTKFEFKDQDATKPIPLQIKYDKPIGASFELGKKQYVEFSVTAEKDNSKIYETKLKMLMVEDSGYLHVQTDRPIYRPNEIVKYRVVALTNGDRPETKRKVKVVIRIPSKNVGISDVSETMSDEFIEGTFKLPEYPVIGIWSVEARYEDQEIIKWSKREFGVRKYVLPTFNVQIVLDHPFILIKPNMDDEYITGYITSEYSYGKKISGKYYLGAKLVRPGGQSLVTKAFYQYPDQNKQARIDDGRKDFRISITKILDAVDNGVGFEDLKEEGATVYLEASVTGKDDSTTESARSRSLTFVNSPYTIKIDRMSKYFMPGTSFEIKADVVDSISERQLRGVPLLVSGPLNCGDQRCPDGRCCTNNQCVPCTDNNEMSDVNGQLNTKINFDNDAVLSTYKIKTADPHVQDDNQASAEFTLHPYSTASGQVLQMSADTKIAIVGDVDFKIKLQYNSAPSELRYMIAARGSIVDTGCYQPQLGSNQHTMVISITSKMVPSFRLFVYYLHGHEMISNSLWIDVLDACKKEIKVKVPKKALPGQEIQIEYEGSSDALIGVSAVDRAAYFLYSDSRLTRHSVFKGLDQYDKGCVKEGGKDSRNVFEEGGFQVVGGDYKARDGFSDHCETRERKKRQASMAVQTQVDETAIDIEACAMDGKINSYTEENCNARREIVWKNKGPKCAEIFVKACKEKLRAEKIARNSGGSIAENAARQKESGVRSNFEESMLWSTEQLQSDGKLTLNRIAGDSISTFEFDTISMHPEDGFCVAETQNMTIFKDVFIQLNIPYSLKRREQTEIKATVFNYANETKKIRLMLMPGENICSHFPDGEFSELANFGIYPNAAVSINFVVMPLRIPENKTVVIEAKALDRDDNNVLDHIRKSILVEPEGEIREIKGTRTFDLTVQESYDFTFNLTFPEDMVPETRQCWLYPYSNFMGPIIQFDPVTKQPMNDVGKVIKLPWGCGEQTMSVVGPNVYAHKYLTFVGRMAEGSDEHTNSITQMEAGFAREITHLRKTDPKVWALYDHYKPSIWLNAFVNKVFAQMKAYYTTMDTTPICVSIEWLINTMQSSDGGFKYESTMVSGWGRAVGIHGAVENSLTLTAYVLISLVESKTMCPNSPNMNAVESAILNAIDYLEKNQNDGQMNVPYTIALVAYAMTLSGVNRPYSVTMRDKLLTKFQYSDDRRLAFLEGAPSAQVQGTGAQAYWYPRNPLAIDIEATAYALLALVFDANFNNADQQRIDITRKIVLWLIEQRDENGGFTSTQDTVVGLEALAEYMIWSNKLQPNKDRVVDIKLTISAPEGTRYYENPIVQHLNKSTENMATPIPVRPDAVGVGTLHVKAEGEGEGTLSYRCIYRTQGNEDPCHYDLDVSATAFQETTHGSGTLKLAIQVSKPVGDASGQSIVEVSLLSGYEAIEDTVKRNSQEFYVDGTADRYEFFNHKLIFYLSDISREPTRLALLIRRKVVIRKPEPASVTVYSYYEPSVRCSKFYAMPNNIPDLKTTCKDEQGTGDEDICKCAEKSCMKCRPRIEQLEKTLCLPGVPGKCRLCGETDTDNCFNMIKKACASYYVYVVNVANGVSDTTGKFVQFEGEIKASYNKGYNGTERTNDVVKFVTRKDCYTECKDEDLISPDKNEEDNHILFKEGGRQFLIIGQYSEVRTDRSGHSETLHYLKEGDYVERIYPAAKCRRAADLMNGKCQKKKKLKNNKKLRKTCRKQERINQSCRNLAVLFQKLSEERGCVGV